MYIDYSSVARAECKFFANIFSQRGRKGAGRFSEKLLKNLHIDCLGLRGIKYPILEDIFSRRAESWEGVPKKKKRKILINIDHLGHMYALNMNFSKVYSSKERGRVDDIAKNRHKYRSIRSRQR